MNINEQSNLFKLLSDPNRLKIIYLLKQNREMCACAFEKHLDCNQSTISHHMKLLVESKLVEFKEVGKWVHYSLNEKKLNDLLECFKN